MGILYNGSNWESAVVASGTANVVNGVNIGASGVAFTIPATFNQSTKQFSVVASSAGTVTVSGTSPQTINGATDALSVTYLTGKTLFNVSGTNWVSY